MTGFDTRLIVRNTGWLYLRSFAVCGADLVTARIVLQGLGVDGFGLYAAVAGVVGIVAFLGGALDETFRRFFSAAIGKGAADRVDSVFAASMGIAAAFAAFVVAVGETAGLAFVCHALEIPAGSEALSFWTYQACLFSFVLVILAKPFVAHAVSAERMHLIAVVGVARAFLLLSIASFLPHVSSRRRLVAYVLLLLCLEALELAYWCVRCRSRASAWLRPQVKGGVFAEMARFCFLSSFKTIAAVAKFNGTEVMLNLRAGVAFNSSWSVSNHLSGALYTLTGNFLEAFSPQLVKLWQAQDRRPFFALLEFVVRYSFFVMWLFAFPVLLFAPEIGRLWLGDEQPPQLAEFIRAMTVNVVFDSLGWPLHAAIIAGSSHLARYQAISSSLMAMGFAFACASMALGFPEWTAPAGVALANALAFGYRVAHLRGHRAMSLGSFSRSVLFPVAMTAAVSSLGAILSGRPVGVALSCLSIAWFVLGHHEKPG